MLFRLSTWLPAGLGVLASTAAASPANVNGARDTSQPPPSVFAVLLYQGVFLQDWAQVAGPLQVLAESSINGSAPGSHAGGPGHPLELRLLASSLEPVTTRSAQLDLSSSPSLPGSGPQPDPAKTRGTSFWPALVPTHALSDPGALDGVEVLIVPGGDFAHAPDLGALAAFLRAAYPRLRYLITVCTGSGLAAASGVLDGRRATTNKSEWRAVTPFGPKVRWVSPARWVVDGNIWTASGVTAGSDLLFAWMKEVYGAEDADRISGVVEYSPLPIDDDPYAAKYGIPPQNVE